ncbi:fumarate reductase/succinate dehydrogenase flavoprotein subunit [Trueperella bernardiae]|uniref:fumarate reductase/succinate dehydrogenase flavoprotein subunit n=1 Tax=Trueperella bernardiae TaxID=59561 RepID=UPI0020449844|nr:fumarate reductase/succinate dehydrogenase flavoprotein subunit [Trueperella bernardiae]MCM3906854.1 fumarate reductase/succinate dehydrogenase flavoprotein subunit [Trueperella bernardiae]
MSFFSFLRGSSDDAAARPAFAADFTPPPAKVRGTRLGSILDGNIPDGDPATAWQRRRDSYKLVSPLNTKKFTVVVVGTGLAGAGCAAALGELGYNVHSVTYHDAPRRAHSVAAQGGINAARARKVDGDSLKRFVTDTVKGGDFRSREAEAFRLGEESIRVIDHMNAVGAPFAREYGGTLATRSFGGVQVSRTYYTRGQTGQQLQLASSQALQRQIRRGKVTMHIRSEMLDLIIDDGVARGVVIRDLVTGEVKAIPAHAVVLATGGYGSVYFQSTLALNSNASAAWRAHKHGAYLAHASFVQFHPTALPVSSPFQSKTILMSESLRNDGRIWVPKRAGDDRPPEQIPDAERDYYLERKYPAFGNLTPRDIASRAATEQINSGHGVGPLKNSVYLDFSDAMRAVGKDVIAERYGNLFHMYEHATGENPYETPMRIAPGAHFTMGGLWTDFDQMSSIPGLFVGGEAGWSYHGANRLGANSLLSACVDGWFTLPFSVPNYLSKHLGEELPGPDSAPVREALERVQARTDAFLAIGGSRGPVQFHRELGAILYEGCGVGRTKKSLEKAIGKVRRLRGEFWEDLSVPGGDAQVNQTLEKAGRVADFLELAELMCVDALDREESAGAHFRFEYQDDGEAKRDDAHWAFASAWESAPDGFVRHMEPLTFTAVPLATRSYS